MESLKKAIVYLINSLNGCVTSLYVLVYVTSSDSQPVNDAEDGLFLFLYLK